MSKQSGKPLETFFEVVIPFGRDEHWANVCVTQLRDKMGLKAEVREVAI